MHIQIEQERLAFAVGCFHFGVRKEPPYQLTPSHYVLLVKQALERITSVNNVAAESICSEDMTIEVTDLASPLEDSGSFLPSTLFFSLTFDIYIPQRLQQNLMGEFAPTMCNEHFRVFLKHAYHSPLCFIQP